MPTTSVATASLVPCWGAAVCWPFEGLTTTVQPVETVPYGPVQDQAALSGLLDRIQSLGLELVEIRQLPASADEVAAEPKHQPSDP
jgi:hypothetical protein